MATKNILKVYTNICCIFDDSEMKNLEDLIYLLCHGAYLLAGITQYHKETVQQLRQMSH